jgi:Tfp pilus assembly protein PilV
MAPRLAVSTTLLRARIAGSFRGRVRSIARDQNGFGIVEVLVAIIILTVGALGTMIMINAANATTNATNKRETGTNLARELVEAANQVSYTSVTQSSITAAMQALPGLADANSTTTGWQLVRRGVTFTVTASACIVDDPVDGSGNHGGAGNPWCADSASGGADSNPDDYRRLSFDVSWVQRSQTVHSKQATIVLNQRSSTSSSATPAVASLSYAAGNPCNPTGGCDLTALSVGQISPCYSSCNPSATSCGGSNCANGVGFAVVTTGSPASVRWSVDGVDKGATSGSGNSWNFTWNLGTSYPQTPVDAVYDISAQAYDSGGSRVGNSVSKTVTLNRFIPDLAAFTTLAGRNPLFGNLPEAEFYPAASSNARLDRDIYAYSTYRKRDQGADQLVCSAINKTWCQDTNPPSNTTTLRYITYPLDRAPDGTTRSAGNFQSYSADVNLANTRPNPPTGLGGTANSDGTTTISWTLPSGSGDPDTGDCVDNFRIYRDGQLVTDRYDRTPFGVAVSPCGASSSEKSTSYTDRYPGGTTHTYWVTAVDTNLAESTMLGPVTK